MEELQRGSAAGSPAGQCLVVHPTGRKSWALRYRWHRIAAKLTFPKVPPSLSLAEVRAEAEAALATLHAGGDPATKAVEEVRPAVLDDPGRRTGAARHANQRRAESV